jgi:hypothetical protein
MRLPCIGLWIHGGKSSIFSRRVQKPLVLKNVKKVDDFTYNVIRT